VIDFEQPSLLTERANDPDIACEMASLAAERGSQTPYANDPSATPITPSPASAVDRPRMATATGSEAETSSFRVGCGVVVPIPTFRYTGGQRRAGGVYRLTSQYKK